jgi:hypothetical protein
MTWHTYEAPYRLTAAQGAASLIRAGNEAHFVFHPHGGLVQLLPATVAARTLANPSGGVQTNRLGRVHLQVEVIGYASCPFTSDLTAKGRADLQRLVNFARAHGIPDMWPAGPPPAYPGGRSARSVATWVTRSGHYGHSQVPENDHGDPGAIDLRTLFARPVTPPPPLPPLPLSPLEDAMLFRAKTASTDGTVPAGAVVACSVNTRHHISGAASPLVQAWIAAGHKLVDVEGQDIVEAFPVRAGQPIPLIDVQELADAIIERLPAGGLTAAAVADEIAARLQA